MKEFFIPAKQEFPEYSNPLFKEISSVVNTNATRPFHLDMARVLGENNERILQLSGHFTTCDGLTVMVDFEGKYEDPNKAKGFQRQLVSDQNSFGEYTVSAILIEPTEVQSDIFSRFRLAQNPIVFKDGEVKHSPFYGRHDEPRPALTDIKRIGKLVLLYDYLHTDFYPEALRQAQLEFTRQLGELGHFDYDLDFLVKETLVSPMTMSSVVEFRDSQQLVLGWVTRLLAKVSLPFKPGEELNRNAIALPSSKGRVHNVKFDFGFYYGKWENVVKLSGWTINLDWTLIRELNSFRNKAYEAWRRKYWRKDKTPIELDEHQSRVFSFFEKFEFVIRALGFYVESDSDFEDVVNMTYWVAFDDQIIKARKLVREEHPDYQPLYLVRSERPIMQENGGQITFHSIENYRIFSRLMDLLLQDPLLPLDQFMELPEFHSAFQHDEILKNRARCYAEAFKQNPNSPVNILNEMDPAYPIAEQLDQQYWDEIEQQIKQKKI